MRILGMLVLFAAPLLVLSGCSTYEAGAEGGGPLPESLRVGSRPVPTEAELRERLTPLQFKVTRENGTEPPFDNEFWKHSEPGIYVDIVDGTPLFSSLDKFATDCGWPAFSRPLAKGMVVEKQDLSHGMVRTEVRSQNADSHLGHVFGDGPSELGGLRYCINSASLRFVSLLDMQREGYGDLLRPFVEQGVYRAEDYLGRLSDKRETATFAGGCFWGMEELIRAIPGVVETEVGYTGGAKPNATYKDVKTGQSGHAESVRIVFDPTVVSYEALLGWFFRIHDPTTANRQGNDIGSQYRSAIFTHSEEQRQAAERVKAEVEKSGRWKRPIVTEIVEAGSWWTAEAGHQDYLQRNPNGYTCHWIRD